MVNVGSIPTLNQKGSRPEFFDILGIIKNSEISNQVAEWNTSAITEDN